MADRYALVKVPDDQEFAFVGFDNGEPMAWQEIPWVDCTAAAEASKNPQMTDLTVRRRFKKAIETLEWNDG